MFLFGNYEDETDARPLSTFRANNGGEPVGGNVTRVLASDMANLSAFLKSAFGYDTGAFDPPTDNTPQKRGILRSDLNLNNSNKFSFNYVQLNSSSDNQLSTLDVGRHRPPLGLRPTAMNYWNSNYQILENRKTTHG